MAASIFQLTLLLGFLGMAGILLRKIPVLIKLPEEVQKSKSDSLILQLKGKIKKLRLFNSFSPEMLSDKVASGVEALGSEVNTKLNLLSKGIKGNHKEKTIIKDNDYWQKLKDSSPASLTPISEKERSKDKLKE